MYNNVGQKIKDLAIGLFFLEALGSVISGIAIMTTDEDFVILGILIMLIGPFAAYCLSLFVYGFGELIEKTSEVAENTQGKTRSEEKQSEHSEKKNETRAYLKKEPEAPKAKEEPAECDAFSDQDFLDVICPACGKEISFLKGEADVTCPWCDSSIELR